LLGCCKTEGKKRWLGAARGREGKWRLGEAERWPTVVGGGRIVAGASEDGAEQRRHGSWTTHGVDGKREGAVAERTACAGGADGGPAAVLRRDGELLSSSSWFAQEEKKEKKGTGSVVRRKKEKRGERRERER